ncbi:(d)CMP kinase [Desulfovibrio litoralis]|uniref:Cytidylate kinase n=1 Tax=Desulfovibrio litoralis DSM 11393 TaxID=1121455 RepID=A0A1M7TDD5_9BACT|nr:(d)CMP kinase [Desulfovibrio litoralis]SHN68750.1 cytidylate kinase [Desulfovibrio litoralis DSM 11393]
MKKIITLDGPAGVGKSSLASALAGRLKLAYLDTGAMFRAIALKLGANAVNLSETELKQSLSEFTFELSGSGAETTLKMNGVAIGEEIRNEEVGTMASKIAPLELVRNALREQQQALGQKFDLVAEGRDMGSVVFPQAPFKFFLDASPEVRAMRRFKQLKAQGKPADLIVLTEQIKTRDAADRNRPIAPLKPAEDAIIVDTGELTLEGVLDVLLKKINQ